MSISGSDRTAFVESKTLSEADTVAVFDVVLRTLDAGFDPVAWRECLLKGLRALTDSSLSLSTFMPVDPSHNGAIRPLMIADAAEPASYARFLQRMDVPKDPITAPIMARWTEPLTVPVSELMPREAWLKHPHVRQVYLGSDMYDLIHSRIPMPAIGYVSVLGFTRGKDQPLYGERERRIIELAHTQIAARIAVPSAEATDAYSTLPTRLQELATHLRGPMSVKQIARLMHLSPHTVNNYVKSIYKRLNVSSRTEIIHMMKSRDGRSATRNEVVLA